MPFGKLQVGCLLLRSGFRLAILPNRPDWWSAAEMVVLLEYSSVSTEELWSSVRMTIGFLVPSMTKALPHIAQFGQVASSRKSLGGSKLLQFKNDGGHCVLGDLHDAKMFWYTSPDLCLATILSWSSTENLFNDMAWFLL